MLLNRERSLSRRASRIHDPVERLRFLRARNRQTVEYRRVSLYSAAFVLTAFALIAATFRPQVQVNKPSHIEARSPQERVDTPVWLVEKQNEFESYSNGLRIDTRHKVAHHSRSYLIHKNGRKEHRSVPVGIVFHSTESHLLPLNPEETRNLLRTTSAILHYVKEHRSYHFMIDRFGRVSQIVQETDSADHAGRSAWALDGGICLNLNHAFIGVAFEARTEEKLNPAQIHAGKMLTEALRSRFDIPAENCITHAQVSVNASNMLIGWHTDWAKNFPFAELGLPNNYEAPLPTINQLGFTWDEAYLNAADDSLALAIHRSMDLLKRDAEAHATSAAGWRARLIAHYRTLLRKG